MARALTGWTVGGAGQLARRAQLDPGHFAFLPALHEPGWRTVLGRNYDQAGEDQAQGILNDIASHPATATHIATKLARHFAGDDPPPALVAKLDHAFMTSGGDLPTLYRVLIDAPETWVVTPGKFRPPWDWLVAVLRGTNVAMKAQPISFALTQLGQLMWKPGSPAGWDDIVANWAAPDALFRRVELAQRIAVTAGPLDARALASSWFGESLSEGTRQSIARAESPAQALALLLVAPEMLRR